MLSERETKSYQALRDVVTRLRAPDGCPWDREQTHASLRPYVAHLIECFGSDRLLWGSDWPVVELAGGFARWRETSLELLEGLSDPQRNAILGETAIQFYGLAGEEPAGVALQKEPV